MVALICMFCIIIDREVIMLTEAGQFHPLSLIFLLLLHYKVWRSFGVWQGSPGFIIWYSAYCGNVHPCPWKIILFGQPLLISVQLRYPWKSLNNTYLKVLFVKLYFHKARVDEGNFPIFNLFNYAMLCEIFCIYFLLKKRYNMYK